MKKLLSAILALILTAAVLSGCGADDIALYKALRNVPDSYVKESLMTFDVQVIEPVSSSGTLSTYTKSEGSDWELESTETTEDDAAGTNYLLKVIGGLASVTGIRCQTTKSGNEEKTVETISTGDASLAFSLWGKADENAAAREAVMAIPNYIRPFLPSSMAEKKYLTMKNPPAQADIGIIGGADGPTAIFVTDPSAIDTLVEAAAKFIDVSLASSVRDNGNTVYTVKLNSESVSGAVSGAMKTLSSEEAANIISVIAVMGGAEVTAAEIKEVFGEETQAAAAELFGKLAETGLLADGITLKYTVNPQGYVTNTETRVSLDLDLGKLQAFAKGFAGSSLDENLGTAEDYGVDSYYNYQSDVKGRIKLGISAVSSVTNINETLSADYPAVSEHNSIDVYKDYEEYSAYTAAREDFEDLWNDYGAIETYADLLEEGETLTLRNNENGKTVTVEPKLLDDGDLLCVPAAELCSIFDGVSVSWNQGLMGTEISYTDPDGIRRTALFPNENGGLLYDENPDSADYADYDSVYQWYWQFADGKFYAELTDLVYDFGFTGRFENGEYCYSSLEKAEFKYDKDMSGNFLFALEELFMEF